MFMLMLIYLMQSSETILVCTVWADPGLQESPDCKIVKKIVKMLQWKRFKTNNFTTIFDIEC